MKVIHKKVLTTAPDQSVYLPFNSKIISVGNQNEMIAIWYINETNLGTEKRTFVLLNTGEEIKEPLDTLNFIGTVLLYSGSLVIHVFEKL